MKQTTLAGRIGPLVALAPIAITILSLAVGTSAATVPWSELATGRQWRELLTQAEAELEQLHAREDPDPVALATAMEYTVEARDALSQWWREDTVPLLERALALRAGFHEESPAVARTLRLRAKLHFRYAEFEDAKTKLERALEMERSAGRSTVDTEELLALVYLEQEDFDSANELLTACLAQRERVGEPLATAFAQGRLALLHLAQGDYDRSRELLDLALSQQEQILGPEHPDVAETMLNVVILLRYRGDYQEALRLAEQVLQVQRSGVGDKTPAVARTLDYAATLNYLTGDLARAGARWEQALGVFKATLREDHDQVATVLSNLGILAEAQSDFQRARLNFEHSLGIYRRLLGPDHSFVSIMMSNLGRVLSKMGDLYAAKSLYEQALQIRERALGPEHPDVGNTVHNIARTLEDLGDLDGAQAQYERALQIYEASLGPRHAYVAAVLNGLATTYRVQGEFDRAVPFYERARSIYEEQVGRDHPFLSTVVMHLGDCFLAAGDLAAARVHYERALATRTRTLGEDHPYTGEVQDRLAHWALLADKPEDARHFSLTAEQIRRDHLRHTIRNLSEREALRYGSLKESQLSVALEVATQSSQEAHVRGVWDSVIASRALIFDEMARRREFQWRMDDPTAVALMDEVMSKTRALSRLMVRRVGKGSYDDFLDRILAAQRAQEAAERKLANHSEGFRELQARAAGGVEKILESMPASSALVSFMRYPRPSGDGAGYVAFIGLRDGTKLLSLGNATELESAVDDWRRAMLAGRSDAGRADYMSKAARLRERIWDPIAQHVSTVDRVFFVMDGALHLVNVGTLPTEGGRFLVEDGPLLHLLNAERDLLPPRESRPGSGLLAVGGPAFDLEPANVTAALTRGQPACKDFEGLRFEALPGAQREAQEIAELWASRGPVRQLLAESATEAAVKDAAPGHRILHLATHGFFLGPDCMVPSEGSRGVGGLSTAARHLEGGAQGALRLSGLALAGANHRYDVGPGAEDGVLTAEEISGLNLHGVEWAVLSACDTGLGEIGSGEGVFGLRRALQLAGAQTVVLSLWSVEDQSAQAWMVELYRARLRAGLTTAEAVQAASRAVLAQRRASGESEHPFYWGGFIAAGSWR